MQVMNLRIASRRRIEDSENTGVYSDLPMARDKIQTVDASTEDAGVGIENRTGLFIHQESRRRRNPIAPESNVFARCFCLVS
jgi:hypothetical protein